MISKEVVVFVYLPGEVEAVPAGTLTLTHIEKGNDKSKFIYSMKYMNRPNAIELDPVSLGFKSMPRKTEEEITPKNNLDFFGAFSDATPDAWGRRVIEKQLKMPPEQPEIVYIENSSNDRVGALDFRKSPTDAEQKHRYNKTLQLHELMDCAEKIENDEPVSENILALFRDGSSLGGARPKAVVEDEDGLWIAKFKSRHDRFDHASVEAATLLMAKECGIVIPELKMVRVGSDNILMVKRFDREKTNSGYLRKHFVSSLTMLGRHESESPLSSYAEICAAIAKYARARENTEMKVELFRRMIFNILVHNNDDHLRNHGFLYEDGGYILSPAYDIVPSPTVTGERYQHLSIGVRGKLSTLDNAMSQPGIFGLTRDNAVSIVQNMAGIVSRWRELFSDFRVTDADIEKIETAFRNPEDIGLARISGSKKDEDNDVDMTTSDGMKP